MSYFDEDMRLAVARREPPPGFAERVMARLPRTRKRGRLAGWFSFSDLRISWMPATAALLIAAIAGPSWQYVRERERRQQAERGKAELILALRITSAKLQATRAKLQHRNGGSL